MFFIANITSAFTWYANGNVFSDGNMTVAYYDNRLNLPNYIQFAGNRVIQNTYAADGRKLHSSVRDGSTYKDGTKHYNGNLVLDKNKKLEYILFDDGRIVHNNGNFTYEYHLKDHLGSVRVAFEPSANGTAVVQENAYYPFGAPIAELSWSGSSTNRYKHTGMETLCDFPNAGYVDNGARWRGNPFAPGFLSIDPLAEKYYNSSPYAYCANNPINVIDPDGRDGIFIAFPDYKISTPVGKLGNLGHAGVLLIDNKTGTTKYYEFGRYDKEGKGLVRNITISDVKIGKDGKLTTESLNKVLGEISEKAGQGGKIEGAYVESDKFKEMKDYAESKKAENKYPDRKEYSLTSNNCGTFAADVLKQDSEVKEKAPTTIIARPNGMVKDWQSNFEKITYDPNKEKDKKQ